MIIRTSAVSSMTRTLAFLKVGLTAAGSVVCTTGFDSTFVAVVMEAEIRLNYCPFGGRKRLVFGQPRPGGLTTGLCSRYAVSMFSLKALSLVALLAIEMPFVAS